MADHTIDVWLTLKETAEVFFQSYIPTSSI